MKKKPVAEKAAAVLRPALVLVQWEDATELDTSAWVQETKHDYKPNEALVNSVGFLLHESAQGVILTSAWCEGGEQVARREQIPRGMIRRIVRIKV